MEVITRLNGNGNQYERDIPVVRIISKHIDPLVLEKIFDNTGMQANTNLMNTYEYRPTTAKQLTTLLMTYNFKIWYFDNGDNKNTLFLKFNHDDIKD